MNAAGGIPRVFRSRFWRDPEQRDQPLCHRELLSAIRAGNGNLAEAGMRMHIQSARAFVAEVMAGER